MKPQPAMNPPTRIKICGITRVADGVAAAEAGADAVGLVFYPKSPRYLSLLTARAVADALPPFVTTVGLFVNPNVREVEAVLEAVPIDLLQFHGDETPEFCRRFGVPYLKAARVKAGVDLLQYASRFADARGLLLDAFVPGAFGGTGERFDWELIPPHRPLPIVLSGGLTPDNVGDAVRRVRPWAVDVSSGVEAGKGIKDPSKIASFIQGVRNADV